MVSLRVEDGSPLTQSKLAYVGSTAHTAGLAPEAGAWLAQHLGSQGGLNGIQFITTSACNEYLNWNPSALDVHPWPDMEIQKVQEA